MTSRVRCWLHGDSQKVHETLQHQEALWQVYDNRDSEVAEGIAYEVRGNRDSEVSEGMPVNSEEDTS